MTNKKDTKMSVSNSKGFNTINILRRFWQNATIEDVRDLIKEDTNVNILYEDNYTPLHWAAMHSKNPEIIKALIKAGADMMAKADGLEGDLPIHSAAFINENPEAVKVFLDADIDINTQTDSGLTPLHMAAFWNKNPEVIMFLLKRGADGKLKNKYEETPFDYVKKNETIMKYVSTYKALEDASK